MKKQHQSERKRRTRTMIQCGGLIQKSGLMDAFLISPGDDLQAYENAGKAARLLGFLSTALENTPFHEENFERWCAHGSWLIKHP